MASQIALIIIAFTNKTQRYTAEFDGVTLKRTLSRKETFSATYSSAEKCQYTVKCKKIHNFASAALFALTEINVLCGLVRIPLMASFRIEI